MVEKTREIKTDKKEEDRSTADRISIPTRFRRLFRETTSMSEKCGKIERRPRRLRTTDPPEPS
jgi:hypothetical protein